MDTHPGEHVLFEGHPSWRSIISFYLQGVLAAVVIALLVGLGSSVFGDDFSVGLVLIVLVVGLALMVVLGLLKRIATTYTITNRRLHIRQGIVARRIQQTSLDRVQNVNTDQSVIERLLAVGSVEFETAGSEESNFDFAGVAQPEEVVEAVHRAQREAAAERGADDQGGGVTPPASSSS